LLFVSFNARKSKFQDCDAANPEIQDWRKWPGPKILEFVTRNM